MQFLRSYGDGFETTAHLRVQICGNWNVGKTTLCRGLLQGKLKEKKSLKSFLELLQKDESTVGADFVRTSPYKVPLGGDSQDVILTIIDLGGQQEYVSFRG